MKEYKASGNGKVTIDGSNVFLKNLFTKENCTLGDIINAKLEYPQGLSNGKLLVQTRKNVYTFGVSNSTLSDFEELCSILKSQEVHITRSPDFKPVEELLAEYGPTTTSSSGFCCPKCKGHNIDLWSNDKNMKTVSHTSLDLNPLHPFTPFKTKTKQKEKTSAAKVGLGILTGGASLIATGTKNKKHNEYYCRDCGNRWIGK